MSDMTLEKKLHKRKISSPGILYNILGWAWKTFVAPPYNLHYEFKTDIDKVSGPYILISNHASRLDYIFTGVPMLPGRMNYVAGHNEFFRSHLAGVFGLLKVIPKKNFVPDVHTINSVTKILKSGGRIAIFPEGMSSISGANQPVAIGTGMFLKHYKVPVYYAIIKGGYLTSPKYNLNDRHGKVEVVIDKLFSPDQLDKMSPEEIEDKVNLALYHDDYAWNKIQKNHYDIGENGAEHLEDLLFWCPRCQSQHRMATKGNTIYCLECGNGATIDDTYTMTPLDQSCIIPETQTAWFNMQRDVVKKEVSDPNFRLVENVKLGTLPKYNTIKNQETSVLVGEGTLTLDKSGLTYDGTRDGEKYSFHISIGALPTYGMCTDLSRFYTFYRGEFMEFYPEHSVVEKFFLATEELHRLFGGKWQDFKFDKSTLKPLAEIAE